MITIEDTQDKEWYDKWLKNIEKNTPSDFTVKEYVDILKCENIERLISNSFLWEDTPEGHRYWSAIARRYAEEYYSV